MNKNNLYRWMVVPATGLAVVLLASSVVATAGAADQAAPATVKGPNGEELVAVPITLPKPLFTTTPKNIKPAPTLEKYNEKPRPMYYAPKGTTNLARDKKVTSSDMAPIVGELSMVTDGDKEGSDGSFVELAPGKQWVQIDLGAAGDISAFVVWHFHNEGRVYHGMVIQISDDPAFGKDVKTVYNNDFENGCGLGAGKDLEYIDDYRGRLIEVKGKPVRGRYVRMYSNGNTSNDQNHYIEVEVLGTPAK